MKQLPATQALHPEWDTPSDGDFARYLERLTALQAVRLPEEPGRVPHLTETMQRFKPSAAAGAPADLPDLQALKAPVAGVLSLVQVGLFLVVVIQVAVLALAGLGSAVGVAAAMLAWWVVGRWKRALGVMRKPGVPVAASLSSLQQQLQALAQQKAKPAKRK